MTNAFPHARDLRPLGFDFGPNWRDWITADSLPDLAKDAALVTTPGTTVPVEFLAYIDPRVVEILTAPRKAREIFKEARKGDWTTAYFRFRATELTGGTEPYSDKAQNRTAGVNYDWQGRENYLFQTVIEYGDLEQATTSAAKISLASDKQRAAANILDLDGNRFNLLGVAGKQIYGLLNAPNLNAALTAAATGTSSSTEWADKTTLQIYQDLLDLFQQLVTQANGWIDENSRIILALPPALSVSLGTPNEYGRTPLGMIREYLPNLRIVTVPEMATDSENTMMMIAEEIMGNPVGELGFSEKVRAGRVVPNLSSFSQKWLAGTYGCVIYYPFAIATMEGM